MTYPALTRAKSTAAAIFLVATLGLTACGPSTSSFPGQPTGAGGPNNPTGERKRESIFGEEGLKLFGGSSSDDAAGSGIGVNSFLWRASLDTISFMPLASADPFGGVIITDWYAPPEAPEERFKVTAYILGRQLRADGVRVSVFRQVSSRGQWVDVPVTPDMATALEDKILLRARDLRVQSVQTAGR